MENKTEILKKEYCIANPGKKPITLDITYESIKGKEPADLPVIIYCHGFKGFKDWGANHLMAQKFATEGFFFVKINFSHNGTTDKDYSDIHDLEAFGNNNFEIEIEDLKRTLDWLTDPKNENFKTYNKDEIFVIGHSRGGGIVLLSAATDSRIKKVACWATVNDLEKYMYLSDIKTWEKDGVSFVKNSRTGMDLPLYFQFYQNFYRNKDKFDIEKNLMNLSKPLLLLHGNKDNTVSMEDSKMIYENVDHSIFIEVEEGDHTFGARHPWNSNSLPEHLNFIIEETSEFFKFI